MSGDMLKDVEASLLAYCKKLISVPGNNLSSFKPFNFDTHATINEIPDGDFMGIAELDITNDNETYTVSCQFVVCTTTEDTNLEKLRNAVGIIFNKLRPGSVDVKIVRANDGFHVGTMSVMSPVRMLPVGSTKSRPIQTVAVQFGSTLIVPP